ncbi:MAG: nucleotidyltransferase domain-containing protein [Bacteroidales bacterium]|nr:nucleotidyltransferase domain-containing protein [Bacteroidales bacterium]
MSVASNFETFCKSLLIGTEMRSTISTRYLTICKRLNKDFWDMDTDTGGRYVGSYGRNTANSWVSDIDMVFELPWSAYNQYNDYQGNGQSALLQAVKNSIATTYPATTLKGDGQIVKISFSDDMIFEVLPVFKNKDDSYTFADSNNGGSWKVTNPVPEIQTISNGNILTNSNLRRLCRMVRSWKYYCNVPIKGLLIDTLAYRFLTNWSYRDKSYLYYDWMSRDFFEYLKDQKEGQTTWYAIGSQQPIYNSENFRYKAKQAYNKSFEAIQYQTDNMEWSSKKKWRDIYGYRYPD